MACRHCIRAVIEAVSDVPGVHTVEVDSDLRTVRIRGTAAATALRSALTRIDYPPAP
jgi:copper chaperone CopZ